MTGRRIVALLAVLASGPALPQAPQTSPQARPQPVGANNPVMRRAATTWAEICAGCHGDGITAGRAPNLFDSRLLATRTDDALTRSITQGQAGGEMPAFGAILPAEQVTQLVTWVRLQTDAVRPKPAFVANPDGAVLRTSKARVRLKVLEDNLDTPWGLAFLPDGRLLVTERPGRLNLVTPDGQHAARDDQRNAGGVGAAGLRPARRGRAPGPREERLDLPRLCRAQAGLRRAA